MTKKQFRDICAANKIEARYQGSTKTFFVSSVPPGLGKHYRLTCPFKVERMDD